MKRSRIFLGVSASLLAVVGVAATKAHKFQTAVVYYYTDATHKTTCIADGNLRPYTQFGTHGITNIGKTLYSAAASSKVRTLYTNGPAGVSLGCTVLAYKNAE